MCSCFDNIILMQRLTVHVHVHIMYVVSRFCNTCKFVGKNQVCIHVHVHVHDVDISITADASKNNNLT